MAAMMAGCWLRAALLRRAARSILRFPGWLEVFVWLSSRHAPCASPLAPSCTGPVPVALFWKVPVGETGTGSTDGGAAPGGWLEQSCIFTHSEQEGHGAQRCPHMGVD